MGSRNGWSAWLVGVALIALVGCSLGCSTHYYQRKSGPRFADVDGTAAVLKLHLASGEVYLLSSWRLDASGTTISGEGQLQGPDRLAVPPRVHSVAIADVARFETNRRIKQTSAGLTTMCVISAVLAVAAVPYGIAYSAGVHDR